MSDEIRLNDSSINCITAYEDDDDNNILFLDLLSSNNEDLIKSIKKVLNNLKGKEKEITNFVKNISNEYKDVKITSDLRKEYYLKTFELRITKLKDFISNLNKL